MYIIFCFAGDETIQEKNKRIQEKRRKHALSSSLMQDLKEEYLDIPLEISQSSRAQQLITKQQQEKQAYEEEYLTRLPVNKLEKHTRRKLTTLGTLGDEITDFGNPKSNNKKRKRLAKSKGKLFKRKRLY